MSAFEPPYLLGRDGLAPEPVVGGGVGRVEAPSVPVPPRGGTGRMLLCSRIGVSLSDMTVSSRLIVCESVYKVDANSDAQSVVSVAKQPSFMTTKHPDMIASPLHFSQ